MKIVINDCYGGFSLSDKAVHLLAQKKGLTLYPEKASFGLITYWTVPPEQRPSEPQVPWVDQSLEERQAYNQAYGNSTFSNRPENRADPDLVAVVEELGKEADGAYASLSVVEIPDNVEWQIEEYDGIEWVAEKHRTWPEQN